MRAEGRFWIEGPPEFEIGDDGLAYIRIVEEDMAITIVCDPNTLRAGLERGLRAFEGWAAKQGDG